MAQLGSGAGSGYPETIDTTQVWVNSPNAASDSNRRLDAEMVNDFADAILAIQTELGTHPSGIFATVAARLEQIAPAPIAGGVVETTLTSSSGVATLSAPNLVPQGARVKAVVVKVTTALSTENGLTGFLVGGFGLEDGWGNNIALTLNTETSGADFRRGDQPLAMQNETIILTALGGTFGATGAVFVRVLYESYTAS